MRLWLRLLRLDDCQGTGGHTAKEGIIITIRFAIGRLP